MPILCTTAIMAAPISSRECFTVFLCFSGTDDHVSKLSDVSHTLPDKRVGVLYLKKWVCSVLSFFWPNPLINKLTIAIIISARAPQKMCFKRVREREKVGYLSGGTCLYLQPACVHTPGTKAKHIFIIKTTKRRSSWAHFHLLSTFRWTLWVIIKFKYVVYTDCLNLGRI